MGCQYLVHADYKYHCSSEKRANFCNWLEYHEIPNKDEVTKNPRKVPD